MPTYGLDGRRALVLCGTRGIGLGVARSLARHGCAVTVTGTDEGRAAAVAGGLPGRGHAGLACDFAEPAAVGDTVATTGPYDVLLLNSPGPPPGPVAGLTADELRRAVDLVLLSVRAAAEAALPAMRQRRWGRLIGVTSSSVAAPLTGLAASSIARSAVQTYLKLLSESVAPYGVTVNHVIPGKIDTDRLRAVDEAVAARLGTDTEAVRAAAVAAIPLGRYGTPADVGELVAFLASDHASYITGTGVRCDGGLIRSP
ncbi:MAG TPA: SDR family oxidoreductase [Pseudonocardiaceae bacterium]